jgi:hypothetical protein
MPLAFFCTLITDPAVQGHLTPDTLHLPPLPKIGAIRLLERAIRLSMGLVRLPEREIGLWERENGLAEREIGLQEREIRLEKGAVARTRTEG